MSSSGSSTSFPVSYCTLSALFGTDLQFKAPLQHRPVDHGYGGARACFHRLNHRGHAIHIEWYPGPASARPLPTGPYELTLKVLRSCITASKRLTDIAG